VGEGEGGTGVKTQYTLTLKRTARKELLSLDERVAGRLEKALDQVEIDPFRARPGVDIRPLAHGRGIWRLRVGDYRALYVVRGRIIEATRICHRSSAYR
jgi:mRNA interferase RelE/StbE